MKEGSGDDTETAPFHASGWEVQVPLIFEANRILSCRDTQLR